MLRRFHSLPALRSAIKPSANKSPRGGGGMAANELAATKSATTGDQYHHIPAGWQRNVRDERYYALACSGDDGADKGWTTWKYDPEITKQINQETQAKAKKASTSTTKSAEKSESKSASKGAKKA